MSFCKGNSHQRDPEKRLKPDSAKEIWYYISELQNPYVAGTTEIANSDVRKHSLTICVGRAEKSFLRLIWISFPFFVSPDLPKGIFRCVWLSRKRATQESLRSWKRYVTQVSDCLATREPETARLPCWLTHPMHPGRKSGVEILDTEHLFV